MLSWGGTYGACITAASEMREQGFSRGPCPLALFEPVSGQPGEVLRRYRRVLIPELNLGQLRLLIRGQFLIDAVGLNKVQGKPFSVHEIVHKISELLP